MQKRIISCINFLLSKENFITTGVHSQKMKSPKRCLRRYGHADHPQSGPTMGVYTVREGVKKNVFFWDFVPNIGPHPPTAHVWDKALEKNVFFLQSLGP